MKRSTLTCDHVRRELAAHTDVPELAEHIADCADCAGFARDAAQLQQLAALLPADPTPARAPIASRVPLLLVSTTLVVAIVGLGYVVVSRELGASLPPKNGVATARPDASVPARQATAGQATAGQATARKAARRDASAATSPKEAKDVDLLAIIDRARSVWLGQREGSATSSGVSDPLALAWLDAGASTRTSETEGSDLLRLALDGRLDTLFSSQPSGATSRPGVGGGLR